MKTVRSAPLKSTNPWGVNSTPELISHGSDHTHNLTEALQMSVLIPGKTWSTGYSPMHSGITG